MTVFDQKLPLVSRMLEGVEVECHQVVEEMTLYLASKNEDFRTEYVQRVAISSFRERTRGNSSRPLPICYDGGLDFTLQFKNRK